MKTSQPFGEIAKSVKIVPKSDALENITPIAPMSTPNESVINKGPILKRYPQAIGSILIVVAIEIIKGLENTSLLVEKQSIYLFNVPLSDLNFLDSWFGTGLEIASISWLDILSFLLITVFSDEEYASLRSGY